MSALETILARLLEAERTGDTETARRLRLVCFVRVRVTVIGVMVFPSARTGLPGKSGSRGGGRAVGLTPYPGGRGSIGDLLLLLLLLLEVTILLHLSLVFVLDIVFGEPPGQVVSLRSGVSALPVEVIV